MRFPFSLEKSYPPTVTNILTLAMIMHRNQGNIFTKACNIPVAWETLDQLIEVKNTKIIIICELNPLIVIN